MSFVFDKTGLFYSLLYNPSDQGLIVLVPSKRVQQLSGLRGELFTFQCFSERSKAFFFTHNSIKRWTVVPQNGPCAFPSRSATVT